jgi:hypothetical protein
MTQGRSQLTMGETQVIGAISWRARGAGAARTRAVVAAARLRNGRPNRGGFREENWHAHLDP